MPLTVNISSANPAARLIVTSPIGSKAIRLFADTSIEELISRLPCMNTLVNELSSEFESGTAANASASDV